jgi:hypothetical protein
MRMASIALLASLFAAPAVAGDLAAEKLFGRDPGNAAAHACFSKTFDDAWLKAHPHQNVAGMMVYVARRYVDDTVWHSGTMQLHFRDSTSTFHATAECGLDGNVLGCSIDCDGGGYQMTVVSKSELGVAVDGRLRYYDISEAPTDARTVGFRDGDKNFSLLRTDLRDCLPLVADEEIKAKIAAGALTQ